MPSSLRHLIHQSSFSSIAELRFCVSGDFGSPKMFGLTQGESWWTRRTRLKPSSESRRACCRTLSLGVPNSASAVRLVRSEEHTSELQSHVNLVCRLLLEKKKQ